MNQTPQQAFRRVFGSNKNFMTPKVTGYRYNHNYYVELSTGCGIISGAIYGVTVITNEYHPKQIQEKSKMFKSIKERDSYLSKLLK